MIISVVNNSGIDVDLYIGAVRHRVFANEQQQDITVNGERNTIILEEDASLTKKLQDILNNSLRIKIDSIIYVKRAELFVRLFLHMK